MDQDKSALNSSNGTALLSVALFSFTLFFFNPARIYIGNFMEFAFFLHASLMFFLSLSLGVMLIVHIAAAFLSGKQRAFQTTVSVLFAVGFLMWLQANILPWHYGVLNGRNIEWKALTRHGIMDTAVWAVVVAFAVVRADLVMRFSRFISIGVIVAQAVSLLFLWGSMPKDQAFKQAESATDTLFLFSEHKNVVILVLDTFQSDLFQEIVQEDPDLRTSFDGFTYFRNALTGSDGTSLSIPNMLTARNYDNSIPYLDFVRQSFLESSLPKTLHEYSFRVDLFPIFKFTVSNEFRDEDAPRKKLLDWRSYYREQAFLLGLAFFRSSPHFVKHLIYNRQRWLFAGTPAAPRDGEDTAVASSRAAYRLKYWREYENSRKLVRRNWDASFIHRFVPSSGIIRNADVFKFYHLNGIHLQLMMNERLEYEEQEPTREAMKSQGTGVLKITAIFLERLRQLQVYDNSLIFIVGDHGTGLDVAGINPSPYGARFNRSGPYRGYFRNFKAAGIPLILAKKMNAKGTLRVSDAPVALGDLPQTVVEELGLEAKFPGRSLFRVKENEARERIYRAFLGPQENVVYFPPLYEYAVNGSSWDDTSWRETGNVYYPAGRRRM